MKELVLASASPRRRELMQSMGLPFRIVSPDADEKCSGCAEDIVLTIARRKANAVAEQTPNSFVLAADTLVECDGRVLGKPENEKQAMEMLRLLSGKRHRVHTGICLISPDGSIRTAGEVTGVTFVNLSEEDIRLYVASKEPLDKAGAYAVQGRGAMFVKSIEGSPSNVIGMPMHLIRELMIEAGYEW